MCLSLFTRLRNGGSEDRNRKVGNRIPKEMRVNNQDTKVEVANEHRLPFRGWHEEFYTYLG